MQCRVVVPKPVLVVLKGLQSKFFLVKAAPVVYRVYKAHKELKV